ncbi:hypothetical protein ILUMI_17346, partial [Ignelater luminosus]
SFLQEVIQLCEEHNFKLMCLPPYITQVAQPLGVAFFAPLKRIWRKVFTSYKVSTGRSGL